MCNDRFADRGGGTKDGGGWLRLGDFLKVPCCKSSNDDLLESLSVDPLNRETILRSRPRFLSVGEVALVGELIVDDEGPIILGSGGGPLFKKSIRSAVCEETPVGALFRPIGFFIGTSSSDEKSRLSSIESLLMDG